MNRLLCIEKKVDEIKKDFIKNVYKNLEYRKRNRKINYPLYVEYNKNILQTIHDYKKEIKNIHFTSMDNLYYGCQQFLQIFFGVLYPGIVGTLLYYYTMNYISISLIGIIIVISFIYTLSNYPYISNNLYKLEKRTKTRLYIKIGYIYEKIQETIHFVETYYLMPNNQKQMSFERRMTV